MCIIMRFFEELIFPDSAINNISLSFLILCLSLSPSSLARVKRGGSKVNEGVHSALLCGANCHVHLARHLYLSPKRIKRAAVNTALTSRGHDFD